MVVVVAHTLTTVFSKRMTEPLSTTMAPTTLPISSRAVQFSDGSGAMVTVRWLPMLTPPSASTLLCASVTVAVTGWWMAHLLTLNAYH